MTVLETVVIAISLYPRSAPPEARQSLLRFFVWLALFAPLTIFLQIKFCLDHLLIALGVVVDVLALGALQLDEIVLGHTRSSDKSIVGNFSGADGRDRTDDLHFTKVLLYH